MLYNVESILEKKNVMVQVGVIAIDKGGQSRDQLKILLLNIGQFSKFIPKNLKHTEIKDVIKNVLIAISSEINFLNYTK